MSQQPAPETTPTHGKAIEFPSPRPDPEVSEHPTRRRFTKEYKRRILAEADQATEPGAIGALLRREGLYSSRLTVWRRQRANGELDGPKASGQRVPDPHVPEIARLRKQNKRLQARLARAERVIEVQGKVYALLRDLSLESTEPTRDSERSPR